MEKFPQAHALVAHAVQVSSPPLLPRPALERVHQSSYLNRVNEDDSEGLQGLSNSERTRLGLPAHPRLLERSALETAGTLGAAWAALEDGVGANLAGGTHHAFPDRGQGYCVLNDVAITVAQLIADGCNFSSILIVDTDAHQGNANHAWFRDDARVFTFSIHVGRNFPAQKEPGDCDVALPRLVDGRTYLTTLRAQLSPVFARLEPDLVFWISGADSHLDDRFGQMQLSEEDMAARDRMVLELCREYAAPTVIVYGGGYNRVPGMTAKLHAQSILLANRILGGSHR
jgi:acetoin utilization deacetylase AcuC-like enzyme